MHSLIREPLFIAIAAPVAAALTYWLARGFGRWLLRVVLREVRETIERVVDDRLPKALAQLRPNNGSSIYDKVNDIADDTKELLEKMDATQ